MNLIARISNFSRTNAHVRKSLLIVEEALSKFQPSCICVSFNGGKDCTVVLHLVHSALGLSPSRKLLAFYFKSPHSFEEEERFVSETAKIYNLELVQYSHDNLKDSLAKFKVDYPETRAIFVGTRSDDLRPGAQMSFFAPTDSGWPEFIRINPILEWSYKQVWDFIRELEIPYCDLYNQGYSSIGSRSDTRKNERLLRYDEDGKPYYLPAWSLVEHQDERLSRSSSKDLP